MDSRKKYRAAKRSLFTRLYNEVREMIDAIQKGMEEAGAEISEVDLDTKMDRLADRMGDLTVLDREIMDEMLAEDVPQDALEEEMMRTDEYLDKFKDIGKEYRILFKVDYVESEFSDNKSIVSNKSERQTYSVNRNSSRAYDNFENKSIISYKSKRHTQSISRNSDRAPWKSVDCNCSQPDIVNTCSEGNSLNKKAAGSLPNKRHFKLPKINLPEFGGDIKDWLQFWSQFEKIDCDESIDDADKIHYLYDATVPGSRAREVIGSFPLVGKNYVPARDALKSRFGNNDLLTEYYFRELLKLTISMTRKDGKITLSMIYDRIETQLRALGTLNMDADTFAPAIFPLVESCLSIDMLRAWQRSRFSENGGEPHKPSSRLNNLMAFLKSEVENEVRIDMAAGGFDLDDGNSNKKPATRHKSPIPTASGLINVKSSKPNRKLCIFCQGMHNNDTCVKARSLKLEDRQSILNSSGCCYFCLRHGHLSSHCKVFLNCILCAGRHVPLMCPQMLNKNNSNANFLPPSTKLPSEPSEEVTINNLAYVTRSQVFLQTLMVKIKGDSEQVIRILFDPGSTHSYASKDVLAIMNYEPLGVEKWKHGLFGGESSGPQMHTRYKIRLRSLTSDYACTFHVLDQSNICSAIPILPYGSWVHELEEKGLKFVMDSAKSIDVLIGADVYGKLLTGRVEQLECGLVAIETNLGWIVSGKLNDFSSEDTMLATTMFAISNPESLTNLWELDVLGIRDPYHTKSREDREMEVHSFFLETVGLDENGRYEVSIPWIEGHAELSRNFYLAKRRLDRTVYKLKQTEHFEVYEEVFMDWLSEGIIEEVPADEWDKGHYLPHRPVFKDSKTTPVRPVFDASAKEKGFPSLNQCINKGINMIKLIPDLFHKFWKRKYGLVADIRKAFLQIGVRIEDRDLLRFLWVDRDSNLCIFRHARVVFGVTASPYLLSAVIDFHLVKSKFENRHPEEFIEELRKSFYIDNLITSVSELSELETCRKWATDIFQKGQFELRCWEFTDSALPEPSVTPVLGLNWDRKNDTLSVNSSSWKSINTANLTRRSMLSIAHRVFDPLGFVCPATLCPKILLQRCWAEKGGWDDDVSNEIKVEFSTWLQELHYLELIQIPRWISGVSEDLVAHRSLHIFCDASKFAYGVVVYLRTETISSVANIQLVHAKSRVAPTKEMTIPRLELLAATIAARLGDSMKAEFSEDNTPYTYWTDSTTVLAWVSSDENWGVFVRNRVSEIKTLSRIDSWRHVPGSMNPADLPSRGCSPKHLYESKWWEGPDWLKGPPESWPSEQQSCKDELVMAEIMKKRESVALVCHDVDPTPFFNTSHDHETTVRIFARMLRFIHNCRAKKGGYRRMNGDILVTETVNAEKRLIKFVQQECFQGVHDNKIAPLMAFSDEEGLIRLKTKITQREDTFDFRFPVILPSKHVFVDKLVMFNHLKFCHVGTQGLLSILRERFWILKGRKTIHSIIFQCLICTRYRSKNFDTFSPALPETRTRDAAVFEVTGVDFAGPLFLKGRKKVWITLFTCAVYRAVHLELTLSLSAESFIQTLRRFIARRGRPSILYSDNGTNFRGTQNSFSKLDWEKVAKYSTTERITWRFNAPTASWWGGWFERLIGLLKQLLRKTLGQACLTYEELETVLCDCEATINSRPLTYVSADAVDLIPITPDMFLHDIRDVGVPDCDLVDSDRLNKRAQYIHKIRTDLRKRFRNEYLGNLTSVAKKKTRAPVLNEIVLIGSDEKKRLDWPLAQITEILQGKDGECRLLKLKTATGEVLRPIQRVYPLEIRDRIKKQRKEILKRRLGKKKTRKKTASLLLQRCEQDADGG